MKESIFKDIFYTSSIAKSIHRVIREENQSSINYQLVHCNEAFLKFFQFSDMDEVKEIGCTLFSQNDDVDIEKLLLTLTKANDKVVYRMYNKKLSKILRFEITMIDDEYFTCQCIDMTQQFLRDDYFDDFLNSNLVMFCITNKDGYFLNINNEFTNILEYQKQELIGTSFLELIHPEDIEKTKKAMSSLKKGQNVHNFINRIRHKNSTYHYIEWRSQPYGDVIFSSALDVTETMTIHQQLVEANKQLFKHTEEIQKANRYLEKLSITDMLTGVYNRRYINRKINEESKRMVRYNYPLSMIFFDLDHFKTINDTYGHIIGDEVLKITCGLVGKEIRETDIFGRWGGEEFVIIAPHTSQDDAVKLAEKLRALIEKYEHPMIGKFTCSFGVVEYNRKESIKEFYERADDALYHAKMDGRNRVFTTSLNERTSVGSVYLEWDDAIHTGNQTIDRQHMSIVKRANELIDLLLVGDDSDVIYEKMKTLMNLIVEHFSTEITILEKIGYPDVFEHKQMHHKLEEKGELFLINFKNKHVNPTGFFAYVVDDIVFGHLMKEDRLYISHLKKWNPTSTVL